MPERIQRRRSKGWRMPASAVYVGRPTKWGNPYRVGLQFDGEVWDVDRVLAEYRKYIGALMFFRPEMITEIQGRVLACWCPLDQPCHADVLIELANK